MAGNTRGMLKEEFEGIHTNFSWIQRHCEKSIVLIKEHKPELSAAIVALHQEILELDTLAQGIYSKL
ncbi:MAG: hypothetical protein MUP81_03670 [Dehalococcoidia bacterium]|nr:hypothetical protein [Dehalococcoidia bacterium]